MTNASEDVSGQRAEGDIEGLGDTHDIQDAEYPLDDIMVRSETRSVAEVVKRIERRRFLAPDFQRDFVWETSRQSKLIESCIMRIPLPVLYVAEGSDGRIVVVDGLQRLTTFFRFTNDELRLAGLGKDHPLHGKRYSDLPLNLQQRVEDTQLTLHILDNSAPQRAKLDIFERVNSGAALTRKQMRNALYNGPGTQWLYEMARERPFQDATGGSFNAKTMRDWEAVNRFAAFHVLGVDAYDSGDMDDFLARAIDRLDREDAEWRRDLGARFCLSMANNHTLFQEHAFRKSLAQVQERRSPINISLFDVMSTMFSVVREGSVAKHADEITGRVLDLVRDTTYANAILLSTNSTNQVRTRFHMTMDRLGDLQELEFLR